MKARMLPNPQAYLKELPDPRQETKNKLHKLEDILVLQRFHIRSITPKFGSVQHISVGGQALPDHQAKPDLQNTLLVAFMGY